MDLGETKFGPRKLDVKPAIEKSSPMGWSQNAWSVLGLVQVHIL